MKLRPSRLFIVCLASLALSGAAGAWAWNKANAAPMHLRSKSSFWELLWHKEKPRFDLPTAADRARTRQEVLALKAKLLAEYPELAVRETNPVSNEENGFLQLVLISGPPSYQNLPLSHDALNLISGKIDWDPELAARLIEEHAEVVDEVERIAAMEKRSSSGMPDSFSGFISARAAKTAADLLLAKARIAAGAGDEENALRHAAAAQNIASHFREIETRSLLMESVVLMVDLATQDAVIRHLLPALGPEADLGRWMEVMRARKYGPAEFAHTLRGEWAMAMEYYLFPMLVDAKHKNHPPDPDELAKAIAETYRDRIVGLESASHSNLLDFGDIRGPLDSRKLSARSRELINIFHVGSGSWDRGFIRAGILSARSQAVLELLEREKQGEVLSTDSMSSVTRDPLSGRPFDFDPATRTVSYSTGEEWLGIDPVALPW